MKRLFLALTFAALPILAVAAAQFPLSLPPPCHVTAISHPVPGLSVAFVGVPFRFIVVTAQPNCSPARIVLGSYGGRGGAQGEPLVINPGETLKIGPGAAVPQCAVAVGLWRGL